MRPPRRALTGRDASGKSIFQSFDVTPPIVTLESRPGLAFYEMYATDDVPRLTGREPDPTTTKKVFFQRVFFQDRTAACLHLPYSLRDHPRAQHRRRVVLKNIWKIVSKDSGDG
jgi:hypothetical protein